MGIKNNAIGCRWPSLRWRASPEAWSEDQVHQLWAPADGEILGKFLTSSVPWMLPLENGNHSIYCKEFFWGAKEMAREMLNPLASTCWHTDIVMRDKWHWGSWDNIILPKVTPTLNHMRSAQDIGHTSDQTVQMGLHNTVHLLSESGSQGKAMGQTHASGHEKEGHQTEAEIMLLWVWRWQGLSESEIPCPLSQY